MTNAIRKGSRKAWSYLTGEKGRNRVRVFAHPGTGRMFLEYRDQGGQKCRTALKHRSEELAKAKAEEVSLALRTPDHRLPGPLTLEALFDNYLREVTPTKGERKQRDDKRGAKLFLEVFGPAFRVETITHRDAQRFVRERQLRGDQRKGKDGAPRGTPIRARAIDYDFEFLNAVLNWTVGAGWLGRNGLHGFRTPHEESIRRPIISNEEYQGILDIADQLGSEFRLAVILAHETGHRIGAIRLLRWSDVDLERATVRWRGENDKIGYEHTTPLSDDAVTALKAQRQESLAIGDAFLLKSPEGASQPVSRNLVRDWWRKAERLAGLKRITGRGWHSFRRLLATEIKDAPLKDQCELGGWKSMHTVTQCYQRADQGTMRKALAARRRIAL